MAQNGLFPVSLKRHRNRYWQRFTSYRFARDLNACPIVTSEVAQITTSFPIVFQQGTDGYVPVAMLSVVDGLASPVVDQRGRWLAPYVPSILRCFPFEIGFSDNSDTETNPVLFVNENSGLVTRDPQDNPFFNADQQLTGDLCDVRFFLQSRTIAEAQTNRLCKLIAEMELFVPLQKQDGLTLPQGFWGIDTRRLKRLPDTCALSLLASGALQLIHAHQISLAHCAWLYRAQSENVDQSLKPKDSLNRFISAMAEDASYLQISKGMAHALG
ncbi:hypothetical protein RKLH11_3550 [Rhodobacteraceae bacterium KLH11]|nr:hypothetical protein RKLH11_3550 [Rhodobacteraceae bacterium KLH11]